MRALWRHARDAPWRPEASSVSGRLPVTKVSVWGSQTLLTTHGGSAAGLSPVILAMDCMRVHPNHAWRYLCRAAICTAREPMT